MAGFLAKTMTLTEWTRFEELYEEFFKASGDDTRLALFIRDEPGSESSTLLIPTYQHALVEAMSPGGWHDAGDITGVGWTLLVGNASANEDFGLPRPHQAR